MTISAVRKDSAYKCKTIRPFPKDKKIKNIDDYKRYESSYWDNYQSSSDGGYYKRENPCYDRYYKKITSSRNIIASDIGIIVKQGKDSILNIVTTSIKTAKPMTNVKLSVYNFQNGEIASAVSDNNGFATIDLKKNKAFYLMAEKNNNTSTGSATAKRGYLKLNVDSMLSVNNFDTSGIETNKGIKGHIYGERAVGGQVMIFT